jgi:pilus assembly protein CpaE
MHHVDFTHTMSISIKSAPTSRKEGSYPTMNSTPARDPDALVTKNLSIALIGPEEFRRRPLASALAELHGSITREFSYYPELDDVPKLLEANYDVIIVELDSNPEYALDLVENICANSSLTVMVYSSDTYPDMIVRCMRAGAREFLTQPITPASIAEAMVRASVRRPAATPQKKTTGKVMIFVGAKGGSGVTTLATNFAVSLAQQSPKSTLLIDLNLPLGDAAVELGLASQYSTVNAFQNYTDLDSNYLSKLLIKHSSGLSVLAAPDTYSQVQASNEAVERLLTVARQEFDYVVIDAGSKFGAAARALFHQGFKVYLVVQVSISELRNANRLISDLFKVTGVDLEIVLNRFAQRNLGIDDAGIKKALTMPATWKIPSDYNAATTAQNTAVPLVLKDSPISRVIRQMTQAVTGTPENAEKKKRFGLFG